MPVPWHEELEAIHKWKAACRPGHGTQGRWIKALSSGGGSLRLCRRISVCLQEDMGPQRVRLHKGTIEVSEEKARFWLWRRRWDQAWSYRQEESRRCLSSLPHHHQGTFQDKKWNIYEWWSPADDPAANTRRQWKNGPVPEPSRNIKQKASGCIHTKTSVN